MVKNIYIDTKIILNCQKAKLHLHLAVVLDPVVGIVVGVYLTFLKSVLIRLHLEVALDSIVGIVVGVHLTFLKSVLINS